MAGPVILGPMERRAAGPYPKKRGPMCPPLGTEQILYLYPVKNLLIAGFFVNHEFFQLPVQLFGGEFPRGKCF